MAFISCIVFADANVRLQCITVGAELCYRMLFFCRLLRKSRKGLSGQTFYFEVYMCRSDVTRHKVGAICVSIHYLRLCV